MSNVRTKTIANICKHGMKTKQSVHVKCYCYEIVHFEKHSMVLQILLTTNANTTARQTIVVQLIFKCTVKSRAVDHTVNIYRYKAIGANATSSVISTTWKCISPCLEILQLLQVILQGLKDYLQELQDFQTGANAFTSIQNYTGCCISPYSFVPINIYSECFLIHLY